MMNTKLSLNLGLLAVVLALAVIAFYEPGREEPSVVHLTDVETEASTHVELQNKELLVFEKRDGHWWLDKPFSAPANDIRVHQLLEIPRAESEAQYHLKPEELAKFELDKPKAILTIGTAKLIFGGSDPLDMRRYVRIGDTLHMVNDDFFHHLIASATDFVDKKLLPEEGSPNEILLPGVKAKLGADGKWINEPVTDADAGIPDLVSNWRGARAIEIQRIDKAPQGDIVRIGFASRTPVEFVIVQREPDLLLARVEWGLQYMLSAEAGKQLLTLQKPEANGGPGDRAEPEEDESSGEHVEDMDIPTDDDALDMPEEDDVEESATQNFPAQPPSTK
jgi:hypothetical protein